MVIDWVFLRLQYRLCIRFNTIKISGINLLNCVSPPREFISILNGNCIIKHKVRYVRVPYSELMHLVTYDAEIKLKP